jgi:hypothetical protein
MSSSSRQWPSVHGGPVQRGPQPHGLSPWIFPSKINSKKSNFLIFLGKNFKKAPGNSNLHNFSTTTPNSVILSPKFSGSLHLSFYAFI